MLTRYPFKQHAEAYNHIDSNLRTSMSVMVNL